MKTARRILIASGTLIIVYAASGALTDHNVKGGALIFLIAVLIAHDGVLLPLMIGVGAVATRSRPYLAAPLIATATVTLVALPLVVTGGIRYALGLLTCYAAIAIAATIYARFRLRGGPPSRSPR
ncbi:hypothetical protein [Winogradskya humida]|uniref:hypothetical protein n=1 Tax=Winogradskya humida TaxID=113566 RepID=UPI001943310C|nr:hypothetical protein [Actinoplanes humidus]